MIELRTDKGRELKLAAGALVRGTGILVRAQGSDGKWGSFDIVELDRGSLLEWLRSRGGKNEWAENVVGILLGHDSLNGGPA